MTDQEKVQYSLQNCPRDNKICPDGSIVMRVGADCKFEACPEMPDDFCDYGDPRRDYWGRNAEQCKNAFECKPLEKRFENKCGCGCELPAWATGGSYCQESERYYTICSENNDPICGVYDKGKDNCNEEWCTKTFLNRCEACKNADVIYAAVGACQQFLGNQTVLEKIMRRTGFEPV